MVKEKREITKINIVKKYLFMSFESKLILENELSSFIIIGIHNSGKNRWNDYFPQKAYDFVMDAKYLNDKKPALHADLYLKYICS